MKAIIYRAPKEFHYTDVADPHIGPDEVLIKVRVCGICGTDLHIHEGQFLAQFPLIPGHEFAGEIVAVGTSVKDVREVIGLRSITWRCADIASTAEEINRSTVSICTLMV